MRNTFGVTIWAIQLTEDVPPPYLPPPCLYSLKWRLSQMLRTRRVRLSCSSPLFLS